MVAWFRPARAKSKSPWPEQEHETIMTIQLSRQEITALRVSFPTTGSSLVRRLVLARNDPGKKRVRAWLMELDDAQLSSSLGLTPEDIVVLRA